MSHLSDLYNCHDRTIPPALVANAVRRDRAAARRNRPPVKLRVVRWKPASLPGRMAAVLVAKRAETGIGTRQDLLRAGFTLRQILRCGDAAVAEAERLWRERGR